MKRPLIIRSRLAPKKYCINIFGTLWARDTSWIDRYVVNHERIHTRQMHEMLFVPFYVWYGLEWFIRFIGCLNREKAYRSISFEREAYTHGHDLSYLGKRRRYAWLRYIRKQNS